ncbi:uncharacterized protein LOC131859992 [Cryptomeria japonica]|uniref:uncharacterized protein LOC131859992 n=1 Tax=Cryptomeria japonica TaxID=3369 RepID=UPI0027DA6EBD|nr:uncharacterized protein LOC131859992 [Cryptomeria japonica]
MKKDAKIEWTTEAKEAFTQIKKSITEASVLASPDYTLVFYIYSFASLHLGATVLMQRQAGDEKPIAFMSSPFKSAELMQWSYEYKVIPILYYPQGNEVDESTNKNILDVIKNLLEKNLKDWHNQLRYALWVDRTRVKVALGTSLYYLVYGQTPVFQINLQIPILKLMKELEIEDQVEVRLLNLLKLDEKRINTLQHFTKHQAIVKRWFDKRAKVKAFQISDLVLLWDKAKEKKGYVFILKDSKRKVSLA